jgi:small-conductance mechanosensitive channel
LAPDAQRRGRSRHYFDQEQAVATPNSTPAINIPNLQHLVHNPQLVLPYVVTTALHVLGALVILAIGFWLAGKADHLVGRALRKSNHVDEMLRGFFASIARYFVLTVTVLAVLSQFGIQTTSLVAVIGAASLAKSDILSTVNERFEARQPEMAL